MQRLRRYKYLIQASIASKQPTLYVNLPHLYIRLVAGLYKPTFLKLEHGLILSSISGKLPVFNKQLHGKRRKQTLSLHNKMTCNNSENSLDKIVHELLPRIPDFLTPKTKAKSGGNYSLKIRQKFPPLPDFEDLISVSLHNDFSGVFLPLNMHFRFINKRCFNTQGMQQYLRMNRLPFSFYSKKPAPAFDDPVVITQNFN